jgi:hypothetical protein
MRGTYRVLVVKSDKSSHGRHKHRREDNSKWLLYLI